MRCDRYVPNPTVTAREALEMPLDMNGYLRHPRALNGLLWFGLLSLLSFVFFVFHDGLPAPLRQGPILEHHLSYLVFCGGYLAGACGAWVFMWRQEKRRDYLLKNGCRHCPDEVKWDRFPLADWWYGLTIWALQAWLDVC